MKIVEAEEQRAVNIIVSKHDAISNGDIPLKL